MVVVEMLGVAVGTMLVVYGLAWIVGRLTGWWRL
jgi:hypothetical protein